MGERETNVSISIVVIVSMITVISIVAIVIDIVVVVIILDAVVVVVVALLLLLLEKSVNTLFIMTECSLVICHLVPTTEPRIVSRIVLLRKLSQHDYSQY